jgi:hypothetical protein
MVVSVMAVVGIYGARRIIDGTSTDLDNLDRDLKGLPSACQDLICLRMPFMSSWEGGPVPNYQSGTHRVGACLPSLEQGDGLPQYF